MLGRISEGRITTDGKLGPPECGRSTACGVYTLRPSTEVERTLGVASAHRNRVQAFRTNGPGTRSS